MFKFTNLKGIEYVDSLLINFAKNMIGMPGSVVFVKDKETWKKAHGKDLLPNEIYKNVYNPE